MKHLNEFKEFNPDDFSEEDLKDLNRVGFQKLKGWVIYAIMEDSAYPEYFLVCETSEKKAAQFICKKLDFDDETTEIIETIDALCECLSDTGMAHFNVDLGPFEVKPEILNPCYSAGSAIDPFLFEEKLNNYFINPRVVFKQRIKDDSIEENI